MLRRACNRHTFCGLRMGRTLTVIDEKAPRINECESIRLGCHLYQSSWEDQGMLRSLQAALEMRCHSWLGDQWKMWMQVEMGQLWLWGWWALSVSQTRASTLPRLASRLRALLGCRLQARLERPGWQVLLGEESPTRWKLRVKEAPQARLSRCWSCSRRQASGRWSQ